MLAVALLGAGAAAPTAGAYAYSTQFISGQGLSAGNAYADGYARPYIQWVRTYSDHTVCPAVASGYGGYTSTPFSGGNSTAYYADDCGYGDQWGGYNPVSSYLHGAAYNPNVSTFDYLTYAYVFWG